MLTPTQCRAARAILGWGVRDFAKQVGINFNTVVRFEAVGDTKASIMSRMEQAFRREEIEFLPNGAIWHPSFQAQVADTARIDKAA